MSTPTATHPDLDALRPGAGPSASPGGIERPAGWGSRFVIVAVALGAAGVLFATLRPLLFPPREVRLAAVRVADPATVRRGAVTEAAGWLEADPFPITVRPLVPGVVETLQVLEGQQVEQGKTVIATLRNVDLENELTVANATLALREREVARAAARHATGRALLEQRLELRAVVARVEGDVGAARSRLESARAEKVRAEAALATARLELDAYEQLASGGSATPLGEARAAARVEEARAAVGVAAGEAARAQAELARAESLLVLAREGVDDPRALAGRVAEDAEELERARAARDLARTTVEVAQGNVARLEVRAPADGIVLRLLTAPGSAAGPQGAPPGSSSEEGTGSTGRLGLLSGALVSLYDPTHLQARVDVQLSDVGSMGAGTEAEILVEALPGKTFEGVVTRLQREADLLKNTLQVKVRLKAPDPLLRPEMLVRARFLQKVDPDDETRGPVRLLVPSEAVQDGRVAVFDPRDGGHARRVTVEVAGETNGMTEVEGPIGPGHKVILDPVEDGEAVRGRR